VKAVTNGPSGTAVGQVQVHVFISGRVQGVNFRFAARQQAEDLGLVGWVRNLRDGRVEAAFQGTPEQVQSMLEWCGHGPAGARVRGVEQHPEALDQTLTGFDIRW
jgi:acylphosphatase